MHRPRMALLVLLTAAIPLAACGGGASNEGSAASQGDGAAPLADASGGAGDDVSRGSNDGTAPGADGGGPTDASSTGDATGANDAPSTSLGDATAGCGTTATTGMHDETLQSGGLARTFHVYVPAKYAASTPDTLVFVFHGLTETGTGSTPLAIEYLSQMDPVSDAQGFLLVYPDGYMESWNAGRCCGEALSANVDDVAFFDAMLARIESEYCIDPKRVYAAGLSNGAFFANRLGCERADVVAAIGPVAGPLDISPCTPSRPVPMLEVHGTADPVVYFDGGASSLADSVPQAVAAWEQMDQCTDPSPATVYTNGQATCTAETACAAGSAVELCVITGGGHQWPGGKDDYLGDFSSDLDTSTALMTFFQAHPMP